MNTLSLLPLSLPLPSSSPPPPLHNSILQAMGSPEGWNSASSSPPLAEGIGWAICLGFGAVFSLLTTLLVWLENRYSGTEQSSEHFNTAGRTVKTGLIAAVVCSQWTWAATLLQSSNVAWQYGVSGPFWYGAGAAVQILLFGILSIEIKRKAPNAHTVCEIIRARWGSTAHKVFLAFCLLTNMLVTAMLLLGGAATIEAMTGLSVYVAAFLIPLGIITYTFADGLAATFLSNYLHTIILHAVLIVFIVAVYLYPLPGGRSQLGSISDVHSRLIRLNSYTVEECASRGFLAGSTGGSGVSACGPVIGNREGSSLTMFSQGGMMFAIINLVGNFGTVFVDQSYWQAAIAARPSAAVKGYLLGGLCWFAIPFALATSLGLACLALELPLTAAQANAGLVPVASAVELLGTGGGVLMLLMVFMAVTSCGSAELIAVSSLLTYDVYKAYLRPNASGDELLKASRWCVVGFGLLMGVLAALLEIVGLALGYVYLLMGVLVGSAVFPIAACLLWRKASAQGAILGAVGGMVVAVAAWLGTAAATAGDAGLTLETTGESIPMLVGNLVAILVSMGLTTGYGLIWPDEYDWSDTRALQGIGEGVGKLDETQVEGEGDEEVVVVGGREGGRTTTAAAVVDAVMEAEMDPKRLREAKKFVLKWGVFFSVVMLLLWPLLSLPAGAPFSLPYFSLWVWIGILWGCLSSVIITVMPLAESKEAIKQVVMGMWTDLGGGGKVGSTERVVEGTVEEIIPAKATVVG